MGPLASPDHGERHLTHDESGQSNTNVVCLAVTSHRGLPRAEISRAESLRKGNWTEMHMLDTDIINLKRTCDAASS